MANYWCLDTCKRALIDVAANSYSDARLQFLVSLGGDLDILEARTGL